MKPNQELLDENADGSDLRNYWIDPKGRSYPIRFGGHWAFMNEVFEMEEEKAEEKGWIKISDGRIQCTKKPNMAQRSVLRKLQIDE